MKKFLTVLTVAVLAIFLAACNSDTSDKEQTDNKKEDKDATETIAITHELDKKAVEVPKNPEKVVVFDFGSLDTMTELGLQDKVVGLPQATVPSYLKQYKESQFENLGSLKEPDFEKVHAAQPDLIIISGRQADLYDEFKKIAPTVYFNLEYEDTMKSFESNVRTLAEIFEKEEEANVAIEEVEKKVAAMQEKTKDANETALVVLGTEGKVSAYGPASRFGFVHDVLGVKPADEKIESSRHGQSITYEYILETNPDIMYIIDRDAAIGNGASVQKSIENDIVKKTNAYKNGKMVYLDGEVWYLAGGGLGSMNQMIDEVAKGFDQ